MNMISKDNFGTVLINLSCSAGCLHCDYGRNILKEPLKMEIILDQIKKIRTPFVLLSGGEPLEYPMLADLLFELTKLRKVFRIATGGHILLGPFLPLLTQNEFFCGISLGTDVLIKERNIKKEFRVNWLNNHGLIKEKRTHFSLTITIGKDFNFMHLIEELSGLQVDPDFFTLSEIEAEDIGEDLWEKSRKILSDFFPSKEVKYSFQNVSLGTHHGTRRQE